MSHKWYSKSVAAAADWWCRWGWLAAATPGESEEPHAATGPWVPSRWVPPEGALPGDASAAAAVAEEEAAAAALAPAGGESKRELARERIDLKDKSTGKYIYYRLTTTHPSTALPLTRLRPHTHSTHTNNISQSLIPKTISKFHLSVIYPHLTIRNQSSFQPTCNYVPSLKK